MLNDGVLAIDTEYLRPLQDASHLIVEGGRAAFVDTGANDAVPLLLDALRQQDLDAGDVDYVFLTHIHLDHAGGAGLLMQQLPNARCVVHPRGAPHMVDPERLIAGTIAVYVYHGNRFLKDLLLDEVQVEATENTEYRRWTPTGCVPDDPQNVDAGDTISIHGMVVEGVFVGDRVTVDVPLVCCTP